LAYETRSHRPDSAKRHFSQFNKAAKHVDGNATRPHDKDFGGRLSRRKRFAQRSRNTRTNLKRPLHRLLYQPPNGRKNRSSACPNPSAYICFNLKNSPRAKTSQRNKRSARFPIQFGSSRGQSSRQEHLKPKTSCQQPKGKPKPLENTRADSKQKPTTTTIDCPLVKLAGTGEAMITDGQQP